VTQSLGSKAAVRWEKPKDKLNPERMDRNCHRLLILVVEVRQVWEQAVDGGTYSPRTETNGRGKGFEDTDPTYSAAMAPTQRQLRAKAKRAAALVEKAVADLEEAASMLHSGLFRTDPEVLARDVEKRNAATQGG